MSKFIFAKMSQYTLPLINATRTRLGLEPLGNSFELLQRPSDMCVPCEAALPPTLPTHLPAPAMMALASRGLGTSRQNSRPPPVAVAE